MRRTMLSKLNIVVWAMVAVLGFIPSAANAQQPTCKELGLKTVVIDPGHGGKDPGALGQSSSSHEKHIVLAVSKLLGEKIKDAYPGVKVIYTRSTDKFIGLHDRAMVARNNNADLFISIHCNSSSSKSALGSSVHILGQRSDRKSNTTDYFERNMSVAQRENEVIVMEEGYETKYTHFDPNTPEAYIGYALQWKAHYESSLLFAAEVVDNLMVKPLQARKIAIDQDIFQVLVEANMPAVLLELAFISNPTEYKYLASQSGQEEIADRLFQAFKSYKTKYDMSLNLETLPVVAADTPQIQEPVEKDAEELTSFYAVQIMSVAKLLKSDDPQLKGLKAEPYRPEGATTYKYIVGKFNTREQANAELKKIKAKFPQAFIIYVDKK
jgi:N-acetylmuramoyl-L-alanine amidase